jgi:tRNA-2-methylthio-N6-dimethylallyladenosine synthase
MNENDSERIASLLRREGMEPVNMVEQADVVVFNTCTIRENADNRFFGQVNALRELKAAKPAMQIVVAGCLAQSEGEGLLKRAPHVDVIAGTHALGRIPKMLELSRIKPQIDTELDYFQGGDADADPFEGLSADSESEVSAWVTIQTGCNNSCAFCIVPAVRGPEKSRPFSAVVDEVKALASRGVTEVTLLGQNVNSYGRDLTLKFRHEGDGDQEKWSNLVGEQYVGSTIPRIKPLFADLLRAVGQVEGIRRVRFTSPHPKDMRREIFQAMAEVPSVCESLHFPLQSGSDRILAAMHRGYTANRYLERLALARQMIDDLAVTTDIIVGFPGETEDDFERTLEVVAAAQFDSAYTFIYSPRPGTEAAARVSEYVDPATVSMRFDRLKAVVDRSAAKKHRERIGRIEEVLITGPSKKRPDLYSARTRQNKLVHLKNAGGEMVGSYGLAEIEDARSHYLIGTLKEVIEAP